VRVTLLAPQWDRPCAVCLMYVPRDDGTFLLNKLTGLPVLRGNAGDKTPCHKCAKVPEYAKVAHAHDPARMRESAIELTDQNRAAYRFYRECRAVGSFPDDSVVRWVAAIVRDAEDERDRRPVRELATAVESLVAILPLVVRVNRGR
jgi:hypothetical protein